MFDTDMDFADAMAAGTGYALFRHGQDRQTAQIAQAIAGSHQAVDVHVHIDDDYDLSNEPVNFTDLTTAPIPDSWDDYIGQEPIKRQMMVKIASAKARNAPLDHILLASGYPGVGKTTAARLIAKIMGVKIIELVPPFKVQAVIAAAEMLEDGDILFIDEIHKLADSGKRGAEFLLKILEDHVAFVDGVATPLAKITVIGATTNQDMLPETITDRFKTKPHFQPYSKPELARIVIGFAFRHEAENYVDNMMAAWIARACRGTPRISEEMVMAARDLAIFAESEGMPAPGPQEVLDFLEVEHDGLTRKHIDYLTAVYQFFSRVTKDGETEYIAGENSMMAILREDKQGIGRIERFLTERGLLNRTTRGRTLTPAGIERAEDFIAEGKGVQP